MFDSPCSNVDYDKELDATICIWKYSCIPEMYRETMLASLQIVLDTDCKTWISVFLPEVNKIPEDPEWFVNAFLPQTISTSVENIYFVVPPKSDVRNKVEDLVNLFSDFFNATIISSLDEIKRK